MADNKMKLTDNSKKVKANIDKVLQKSITECTLVIVANAKMLAKVGKISGTGQLRDKINNRVKVDGDQIIGQVGTPLIYAPYVEFGTGEFAENGMGRKGGWTYKTPDGQYFFTKGMRPDPFLRPAFRQSKEYVKKKMTKDMSNNFK